MADAECERGRKVLLDLIIAIVEFQIQHSNWGEHLFFGFAYINDFMQLWFIPTITDKCVSAGLRNGSVKLMSLIINSDALFE